MRYLIIISLLLISTICAGQGFTPDRSSPSITVQDARWRGRLTTYLPHTHGLTLNGGLDTLGAILYEDSSHHVWFRDTVLTGGHQWTMILSAPVNYIAHTASPGSPGASTTILIGTVLFSLQNNAGVVSWGVGSTTASAQPVICTIQAYTGSTVTTTSPSANAPANSGYVALVSPIPATPCTIWASIKFRTGLGELYICGLSIVNASNGFMWAQKLN